jgi:hypothetical protein
MGRYMGSKEIHSGILVADRTHLGEITSMLKERVHGLDDGANVRFRADATDAHLSSLLGQLVGEMDCDHQDGNVRKQVRDLPGNVNPVYIRHLEVQQDHVRGMFPNPFERFSSGGSFVANPPGTSLFEEAPKIVPHRRVVIYHKNSNQAGYLPFTPVASGLTGNDISCRPMSSPATAAEHAILNAPCCDLPLYAF